MTTVGDFFFIAAMGATPLDVSGAVAEQLCRSPTGTSREIVVCGRRKREERYRMPGRDGPFDPSGNVESVARERQRWGEGGEAGIGSCGPVGPGGWTGCLVQRWKREDAQTQMGKNAPAKRW